MADITNIDTAHLYDVIVVGGGPAGLSAAIYLARARYRVLVVEKERFGGQITITSEVVNYPGVLHTSGSELTETMRQQAHNFGAEFLLAKVERLDAGNDIKTVHTSRGVFHCFGILLATGAQPRTVGFAGEKEFRGRGVAYCATCDGEFFTGKDIFVVGGGYAAAEESVFLTRFARHITILMRGEDFSCARSVAEKVRKHEKITVVTSTVVEEVRGDNGLRYIRYRNTKSGEISEFHATGEDSFGVFVFAGYAPATSLVRGLVDLDDNGYVITGPDCKTSVDGLYAAGDVCIKPLRQVVTAVSDGAMAATELELHAAALQGRTGLVPQAPEQNKVPSAPSVASSESQSQEALFSEDMIEQLRSVFEKMSRPLVLRLHLDDRPVSRELEAYMRHLAALTDKLSVEVSPNRGEYAPSVSLCLENGEKTGLAFHGVPGGHEFTSFVLGLYNAAGPGQTLAPDIAADLTRLDRTVTIKVLVSLSCTMCPELVIAAQHLAAVSPLIQADVYDINHFESLKNRFNVMSVPCLILNDTQVSFGRKNIRQVLDLVLGEQ